MTNLSHSNCKTNFKQMDFKDMPEILGNLKKDWPDSIHTYFFLLNFMNWTRQGWDGEFNFYCPDVVSSTNSVMAVAKFKDGYTFVHYHCLDRASCKSIHKGITHTNLLNWDELLIFEAIHERLVPGLQELIQEKGLIVVKNDKCSQVWMRPTRVETIQDVFVNATKYHPLVRVKTAAALNHQNRQSGGNDSWLPAQLSLYVLDGNYTRQINQNWGYSGPGTEVIVKDSLTLNGGLALGKNNSVVGWSVVQHYGGIGMLFIRQKFRRQGYAASLVKAMIRYVISKGIDPFAIIEEKNNQSSNLFKKLNFEHICMVHWIGVQRR